MNSGKLFSYKIFSGFSILIMKRFNHKFNVYELHGIGPNYNQKLWLTRKRTDIAWRGKNNEVPNAFKVKLYMIKKFKQNFLLYRNVVAFRDTASKWIRSDLRTFRNYPTIDTNTSIYDSILKAITDMWNVPPIR